MLSAPAAIPPRETGTDDITAEVMVGVTRPTPTPTRNSPTSNEGHREPEPSTAWARPPAPTKSMPMPMIQRGSAPCSLRPIAAETVNAARLSGRNTSPAWIGDRANTDCSQIEAYAR